jgi:predicted Zn-dependent protease
MLWFLIPIFLLFPAEQDSDDLILKALKTEVQREFPALNKNSPPVYYLAYKVEEEKILSIGASLGKIHDDRIEHTRKLDTIVRVGSPQLDNTHEIKGRFAFDFDYRKPELLPLEEDEALIRRELWKFTQEEFGKAIERYHKVKTNESVMAKAEDQSPDFSLTQPAQDIKPTESIKIDKKKWTEILKNISFIFRSFPEIYESTVHFRAGENTKYFVDSSGTILRHPEHYIRLYISAETRGDDGMPLFLHESFSGFSENDLPSEKVMTEKSQALAEKLMKLRVSPAVEPYLGPAIFMNEATGVFFHEVMGHRLEGHRQKSEKEGQTFTKKVGEEVLPSFMDLVDDPTKKYHEGKPLLGHYFHDDEGVKAQKATLVENGVLKGFLLNRSPIANFPNSNGHGRGMLGMKTVARQSNLMVLPQQTVPFEKLKQMLVEECKKREKPYGLIFDDVSGGFTMTGRYVQAFKVIPLEVYRIYTDGRPDELVRGVDIVGTPLAALEKILAASDDYEVFNGFCGAESGIVPVSALAPSILVEEIEVEKKEKDMKMPPILPSPFTGGEK